MTTLRTFTCPVRLTKSVQDAFKRFGWGEAGFLTEQPTFTVQIEKNKEPEQTATKILLYFTDFSNPQQDRKVPVLTLLLEDNVMTAVHFMMVPKKTSQPTNWRRSVNLSFSPDPRVRNPIAAPFREWLHELPLANERTDYVKKRIVGWEGYLAIQEQQMDVADIRLSFTDISIQKDFRKLTLYQVELKTDQWKQLKDMDVKLVSIGREIGKVAKANPRQKTIEVDVVSYMEDVIRKTPMDRFGNEAVLTNFASLSQIRRLRSGFHQLEKGHAENPLLEQILFEESPPVAPLRPIPKLTYSHPLNEFQRRAVEGAFAAEDLYVIQGPPGTGKTTVISEICLQNAKAGLRTLVASQSNLAVDNALSRLLANKDIRILRVGRTESIEEEGKRFIEENIGDYWREVTLSTVTSSVQDRERRLQKLSEELHSIRPQFQEAELAVTEWQEKVQEKKRAVEQQQLLLKELEEIRGKIEQVAFDHGRFKQDVQEKQQLVHQLEHQVVELQQKQEVFPTEEDLLQQLAEKRLFLEQLEHLTELKKLYDSRLKVQRQLSEVMEQKDLMSGSLQASATKTAAIRDLQSVAAIHNLLQEEPYFATSRILFKVKGIEGIRALIKTYHPAKEMTVLYEKALQFFIEKLDEKRRPIRPVAEPVYRKEELISYLEQGRQWIKIRQLPSSKELGDYVQGLYSRMRYLAAITGYYEELVGRGESELTLIREELLAVDRTQNEQLRKESAALEERAVSLQLTFTQLDQEWEHANGDDKLEQLEKLDETTAFTAEREVGRLQKLQMEMQQFVENFAIAEKHFKEAKEQLQLADIALQTFLKESAHYTEQVKRIEQEASLLNPLVDEQPEQHYEAAQKRWLSLQFELGKLEKENEEAPLHQKLQSQWQNLLENATAEDVDEIRKLNVKYANVIGTTCVASARKDFVENYPSFDVVIIDEVSKATPPELLLPMLKGKKVILVGDHHQLPPLLGDDTLEEVLEKMVVTQSEFTGKQEIEKLLKESLFERLYRNLPTTHKTMLAIQYRMHEDIMQTIAPFYQDEQDALECGLVDSDAMRAHGLELSWLSAKNHVLWIDLPHGAASFEQRVKGGRSLWNPTELAITKQTLIDMNDAVARAKDKGVFPKDYQKSVGVISFYGEQVKQLNRLIQQELRLPHLQMRTGTVDRFQGMEMEVILLNMVRNHEETRGDIGFANDYRRLNVALSRAKELLVLIGSQTMFTERVKRASTQQMYTHVAQTVDRLGGKRMMEEVVGSVGVSN
ncbi:AAA domain-containing protein [Chryseomicrobium sp. FSL W7-1435]|uniref:AAA domain-containing protein n=1 Tax=Chryseomicrobium sp. FSL W7-1435 TaxID=2921704 RepID=UPI00315ADCC7